MFKHWQHGTSYTNNKIQEGLTLETKMWTSLPGLIPCISENEDYPATESPFAKKVCQPDATIWSNFTHTWVMPCAGSSASGWSVSPGTPSCPLAYSLYGPRGSSNGMSGLAEVILASEKGRARGESIISVLQVLDNFLWNVNSHKKKMSQ